MSASGVWQYPRRHSTLQRARTSEVHRQRHGHLDPLVLVNMTPIPGVRHTTCQWPLATRPVLFCAAPVAKPGCSWCADHVRIVFAPTSQPPESKDL